MLLRKAVNMRLHNLFLKMKSATAKLKNSKNVNNCNITTKIPENAIRKEKCNKEFVSERVTKDVFHRKSDRRRVARDIFLVFEKQSSSRRSRTKKKQTKPKFGHLKVDEQIKSKSLLRDLKNEPRCYLKGSNINVSTSKVPAISPAVKTVSNICGEKKKKLEKTALLYKTENSFFLNKSNKVKSLKISGAVESQHCFANESSVARVNPIFLWVKQDGTRIVEVRCEDYDKRNRIRITKTSNGWRAIPRSDPTSSKVIKFYPAPLIKVKKENQINEANGVNGRIGKKETKLNNDYLTQNVSKRLVSNVDIKLNVIDTVCNSLITTKISNKKSREIKKKNACDKIRKAKITTFKDLILNCESCLTVIDLSSNTNVSNETFDKETKATDKWKKSFAENNNVKILDNINVVQTSTTIIPTERYATYQNDPEGQYSFQLCPKTGLFLPSNKVSTLEYDIEKANMSSDEMCSLNLNNKQLVKNLETISKKTKTQSIDNSESLEAKTKNLKDLLDNADLLQHCDDNANSDVELIDSIVKTTCENNLIKTNEIISKSTLDQLHKKTLNSANELVVHLTTDVNSPPKCLSPNEAGKIDIDIVMNPQITLHSTAVLQSTSPKSQFDCETTQPIAEIMNINKNKIIVSVLAESPEDLSYKKRGEFCPPPESRSQCAVTSSSDVESSQNDNTLTTSSETLENLILKQFTKFNSLSKQKQTIDYGKQRKADKARTKSVCCNSSSSSKPIETVATNDNDKDCNSEFREEPLKKHLRLNSYDKGNNAKAKITMQNKDPDPLIQLRLLIQNTQWKLPDPILVPKDRLGAVLASPAREIPLLITTRPELRLPEAFAHPEIIQNPNILVISMAQLEAILENDMQLGRVCNNEHNSYSSNQQIIKQLAMQMNEFSSQNTGLNLAYPPEKPSILCSNNKLVTNDIVEETPSLNPLFDTNQEENATMTILNQMLWLPYSEQISQDILKTLKNPIVLQQERPSLLPFYSSYLNGLRNLEEMYEKSNILTDKSATYLASSNVKLQSFKEQNDFNLNEIKTDLSHCYSLVNGENILSHHSCLEANLNSEPAFNCIKQPILSKKKDADSSTCKKFNVANTSAATGKTYNLRSSVAGRQFTDTNQYAYNRRQNQDNKPWLTCKSLSNLLEPDHSMVPPPKTISFVSNLSANFVKEINEVMENSTECRTVDSMKKREVILSEMTIKPHSVKSYGRTNNIDISNEPTSEDSKERENISGKGTSSTETNVPLWHPLFGSNTKSAYSSPWQWTTVTASEE